MSNTLRVISYNMHKGFSFANTQFLLKEMRHCIREVKADMVFLQEVVGENSKQQYKLDHWISQQFEFLADEVWPHYAYGKNAIYEHGHHGNAILSQYPFEFYENTDVSLIPSSQRGILLGKTINGVYMLCVHLGLFHFERIWQLKKLLQLANKYIPIDAPLLICGDFNDWHQGLDKTIRKELAVTEAFFYSHGKLSATFPAIKPFLAMDRIYFRNLELQHAEVLNRAPWNKLSDHCALLAEFKF